MKKILFAILLVFAIAMFTGCKGSQDADRANSDNPMTSGGADQQTAANADANGQSPADDPTAPAYQMDLTLDTSNALTQNGIRTVNLSGRIDITFTNTSDDDWPEVCLRDYADSIIANQSLCGSPETPEGIASVTDQATGSALTFEAKASDPSVIYVKLDKALAPGARMTLSVDYKTPLPSCGARMGWFTTSEHGDITVNLGPFYPVLAVYENGKWNESPIFSAANASTRHAAATM